MAAKPKGKTSTSSFMDDSLFDDKKLPLRGKSTYGGSANRSSTADNIFSMLAEEVKQDGEDAEDSDFSEADPEDILRNLKDMDDMDADLFGSKKKASPAPAQTKPPGNQGQKDALESIVKPEGADEPTDGGKKPNSAASSSARNYKKFTFSDLDDPLADLLPEESKAGSKASIKTAKPEKSAPSPSASPIPQSPRARTRLDEILENLRKDQPPTQDRPQQQQEKSSNVKEPLLEDDLTFGSYQPTFTPEGRQSRRQSVRFSTEDVSATTPEKKPKATTPSSARSRNSADWLGLKVNDDFLEGDAKEKKTSTESLKAPSSPLLERKPSLTGGLTAADTPAPVDNVVKQTKTEFSRSQKKEEDDDWLAGALSRKKTQSVSNPEAKGSKLEDSLGLGDEVDLESSMSKQVTSQVSRSRDDTFIKEIGDTFLGQHSPAAHSTPAQDERAKQDFPPQVTGPSPVAAASVSHHQSHHFPSGKESRVRGGTAHVPNETLQPLALSNLMSSALPGSMGFPQQNQMQNTAATVQQQLTLSADSLQQLLLQQQMLGLGAVGDTGALQRLKEKEQQPGDHLALQARIIQLEGQVKALQLERDQNQMLLESVQQRHKQDMELMENAHKVRVKLLEESAAQRDTRSQQECENLMERLATATRAAEQERSELQAQYQRKLAQAQQDRDREVERLRDLQRKSILEMKKDHEDQVQRLKKLKDEEIDAVTSATSQTRSLTVVIEQMEQFSSRLGELSSRVESTHEHTAHGLEQGERHRDEQRRIMQDRLSQQQKAMVEERAYLKEIISRMDTQLNEQQRQLEKERWKMTAEQAKAESTQRGLEEERRALSMQISMEREELERAKSALLEEQKTVMQLCAEERRKLAAEWSHFHAQEKQRHERAEREVSSLLEKREGSIMSLAQEQADLKLRSVELKQRELAVAQERETLERLREEVERDKERISSTAVRLKTRAQEVEAFSKLAAEKYEEGERALEEAKRVEAQHEERLRNIHSKTGQLRQEEQRILQERMRMSHLQNERLRQEAPITSLPLIIPPDLPDSGLVIPNPELPSTLNVPPPTSYSNSQSMALQASLALWKYTAEKDREYLQEEQIFLDNLKKKSYR